MRLGYALSSEEHTPLDLVRNARRAEEIGFSFALISDHFHPWIERQGHSPFVWSVIGGIAQATQKLELGTGVTAPIIRTHPAIIAQAAATSAAMMPGRFFLGVGTGENLNEHIFGDRWPPHDIRSEMLAEAVKIMRMLWTGETISYWGDYFDVEDARLFTLPDAPPPIVIAAGGPSSAELAGRIGDGLVCTSPEAELVEAFRSQSAGENGSDRPRYGKFTVCWAKTEKEARSTVFKGWPTSALGGELNTELRTFKHFEQATKPFTEDQIAESFVLGPDPEKHLQGIQEFVDAGFDHIYVHQIGSDQDGFFKFYEKEILPKLKLSGKAAVKAS